MRPQKTTVDYFPHRTNSGRTIFILENLYGNNGYAAWFKILELLGSSPGHSYEFNSSANFQYLTAKLGVSGAETIEILNTLADVDAIDKDLHREGVIWSENFVDGLDAVYTKRSVEKPRKPGLRLPKPGQHGVSGAETIHNGVLVEKTPRRKGKEREVKESEGKGIKDSCSEVSLTPSEPECGVMQIPLNLKGSFFVVSDQDVEQWQESFPGVDVLQELRKCRQWNIDNQKRRKTKAGIRGHISAWLGREQDSSRGKGSVFATTVKDVLTIQSDEIARVLNDEHRQQQQRINIEHGQEGGLLVEHQAQGSRVHQ